MQLRNAFPFDCVFKGASSWLNVGNFNIKRQSTVPDLSVELRTCHKLCFAEDRM